MTSLRALLRSHRWFAAWLIAAALLVRVVVPAGFMPVVDDGRITISICTGYGPMTMAMPGAVHHDDAAQTRMPCAFADLALPVLGGADVVLLVAALLFAFVVALLPRRVRAPIARTYLRPPLRGPPLST